MAVYSAQLVAGVRHDYENTDKTLSRIAVDHGISERTVTRIRDREGWTRRSERLRDVPPAMRALQEATALLTTRSAASAQDHPPDQVGLSPQLATHAPGGAPEAPAGPSAIERIERLVE